MHLLVEKPSLAAAVHRLQARDLLRALQLWPRDVGDVHDLDSALVQRFELIGEVPQMASRPAQLKVKELIAKADALQKNAAFLVAGTTGNVLADRLDERSANAER